MYNNKFDKINGKEFIRIQEIKLICMYSYLIYNYAPKTNINKESK